MERGCLVVTAVIAALVVLVAALLLFVNVPLLFPRLSGYQALSDWVEQNTRAELATGWIAPLIYPGVGLQVRALELKIKDKNNEPQDFFGADAIKILADAEQLFKHRKLVWTDILVDHPRIVLVRESKGKWNVTNLIKSLPNGQVKTASEESLVEWIIKDSLKNALPELPKGVGDLVDMGRIEVEDAELILIDKGVGRKGKLVLEDVHMKDVSLIFTGAEEDEPARFELSFPFPQGDNISAGPVARLAGTVAAESNDSVSFPSITGEWWDVVIHKLSGKIDIKPEFKFEAEIDSAASFRSFYRAAMWGPIARSRTIPDMRGSGKGRVRVKAWGPDHTRAARVHYGGRVELYGMTWDPGRVLAPLEDLRTTIYLEDGVLRMPESVVRVAGSEIRGKGKMIESKNPRFELDLETNYLDFGKFFQPRRTPYQRGQAMLNMKTLWGGKAIIREGAYNRIRIYDAKGAWDVTNQRLATFPELFFRACNGTYLESGRSWMDFNDPVDYKFHFDGSIRGMDMTMFADQIFETTTFLHGAGDADGYVDGVFTEGEFVPRSLGGKLKITFRDGYFEGFNLIGGLLGAFGLEVPEELKGQRYRVMSANVRFDRGVAYFSDLKVDSIALGGEARGWIDFASQHTDMKIKISFLRPLRTLMSDLPLVGVVTGPAGRVITTLYVRAYGHWDYLNYAPWNPLDESMPKPPDTDAPIPPPPTNGDSAKSPAP